MFIGQTLRRTLFSRSVPGTVGVFKRQPSTSGRLDYDYSIESDIDVIYYIKDIFLFLH